MREYWGRYVPVAERRRKAQKRMDKLRKKGEDIRPVEIQGRTIARSFWGKGWCGHLESFSDYANRLPRGRTYVRNGSVCHLDIQSGRVKAIVSGTQLYHVDISIKALKPATWESIRKRCSGQIGSMLELLQGKLSDQVMTIVTDRKKGLFPKPGEIELRCTCPDWATMCKHVAAVLYGVGSRLDSRPELLFVLRDVDAEALIAAEMTLPDAGDVGAADSLAEDQLGAIFDIDIDSSADVAPAPEGKPKKKPRAAKRPASPTPSLSPAKARPTSPSKKQPTGKSIARLREQLGLSVTEFADQLGVTTATVYRWESVRGRLKMQSRPLAALNALKREAGKR